MTVSVLYDVGTFICIGIKHFCNLVISQTFFAFFQVPRSLHFKVVSLERTVIYGRSMCSLY